jgi:Chaperone of endosialidase
MKTNIPPVLITFAFVCFGLFPKAQAVVPPPDGGYPGGNTAEGQNSLLSLTSGTYNTAVGFFSLSVDSTGNFNTANGAGALLSNTADDNTATGAGALLSNTEGSFNTASGAFALFSNTAGDFNTATGFQALFGNTTGSVNTATGYRALQDNTTGTNNTATGFLALANNTEGDANTATGYRALHDNTTGIQNTAIGYYAGHDVTGDNNVCIGANVFGAAGVDNTTWIRNVYDSVATARAVYVNANNKIGTLSSSRRYKEEIRPMAEASEAILALRPMTFRYKKDIDPKRSRSFGLIAEDVAKVSSDLITCDEQGNPQTVRYEAINAMLLNEFLKARRQIDAQQKQIEALTAGLQKVSAQLAAASPSGGGLEASEFATGRIRGGGPAPQVVNNP